MEFFPYFSKFGPENLSIGHFSLSERGNTSHDNNKPVITCLPRAIWPKLFSFLIFRCYFVRPKSCNLSWQNIKNSENISYTVI